MEERRVGEVLRNVRKNDPEKYRVLRKPLITFPEFFCEFKILRIYVALLKQGLKTKLGQSILFNFLDG